MGNVFVVGDLNVDVLLYMDGLPRRGEEMHANRINFSLGGNSANFAFALGKLGMKPKFYSAIGNDFSRDLLIKVLTDAGVDTRLKEFSGHNGYTIAMVEKGGERSFISNKGACLNLTAKDLDPVLEAVKPGDIVYSGGLFHLPELAKGFPSFLNKARKKGATTMLDLTFDSMGCSDCFPKLSKYLDMVFLNETEAKRFGKGSLDKSLGVLKRMGITDIIVKMGSKGSLFHARDFTMKQPASKVKAVDTTGAGDIFNAGFVYGFMSGLNPDQCLKLGNWVAGYKVAKSGLKVPPREDVIEFVRKL